MYLKDPNNKLEGSILRDKLELDVEYVECAVDIHGRLVAQFKTQAKYRRETILRHIMGDDAYRVANQPVSQNMPVLAYNQCVPSDGHKIQGSNGIQIFGNSKQSKYDYKECCDTIDKVKTGLLAGKYLGIWEYDQKQQQKRQRSDECVTPLLNDTAVPSSSQPVIHTDSEDSPASSSGTPQGVHGYHTPPWAKKFISQVEEKVRQQFEERDQRRVEEIRELREQIAVQGGQLQVIQDLNKNVQAVATIQEKLNQTVTACAEANQIQLQSIASQQAETRQVVEEIAAQQTERDLLRQDLEATKQKKKAERRKKRSLAAKVGASSRKINAANRRAEKATRRAAMAEQALARAEAQSISNSHVIAEVRRMEYSMVQQLVNSGAVAASLPFGDLANTSAYTDEQMEAFCGLDMLQQFESVLKKNYTKGGKFTLWKKRDDLCHSVEFPSSSLRRLFMYQVGVMLSTPEDFQNLDDSPEKHRYNLTLLSGPIFREDVMIETHTTLEIIREKFSDRLGVPFEPDDMGAYQPISGDAFQHPDLAEWRLEPILYSSAFVDSRKRLRKKCPGVTDQTCWRYFTFQHMVGSDVRNTKETHIENIQMIEKGVFYSKVTLEAMEEKLLSKITALCRGDEWPEF